MVWRALSHYLPKKSNLYAKFVPIEQTCPVCNREEESKLHVLVECEFAAQCWRRRGSVYQGTDVRCFADWLSRMFDLTSKEDHAEIVMLCWVI